MDAVNGPVVLVAESLHAFETEKPRGRCEGASEPEQAQGLAGLTGGTAHRQAEPRPHPGRGQRSQGPKESPQGPQGWAGSSRLRQTLAVRPRMTPRAAYIVHGSQACPAGLSEERARPHSHWAGRRSPPAPLGLHGAACGSPAGRAHLAPAHPPPARMHQGPAAGTRGSGLHQPAEEDASRCAAADRRAAPPMPAAHYSTSSLHTFDDASGTCWL